MSSVTDTSEVVGGATIPEARKEAGRIKSIPIDNGTGDFLKRIAKARELATTDLEAGKAAAKELLTTADPTWLVETEVRSAFISRIGVQVMTARVFDQAVKAALKPTKRATKEFVPSVLVEAIADGSAPYVVSTNGNPVIPDGALKREVIEVDFLAGGATVHILTKVESPTFSRRYAFGVVEYEKGIPSDGKRKVARRVVISRGWKKAGADGEEVTNPAKVIFEGTISVLGRPQMYRTTPGGEIVAKEWSDNVIISTQHKNGDVRTELIPAMALRDLTNKAQWMDPLGFSLLETTKDIGMVIRQLAIEVHKGSMTVSGMGPVIDKDGRWVYLGEKQSYSPKVETEGSFDVREIIGSQSHIPLHLRYYGTTPPEELNSVSVKKGMQQWEKLIRSSPGSPAVRVAPAGNVISAVMGSVDGDFWSCVFQSGEHGCGKSYSDKMFDAIQSRSVRAITETSPKPYVNLGSENATVKGAPIRMAMTRGYSVTTDDVLKKNDARPNQVMARKLKEKTVSSMVRSKESGGGAQGGVNFKTNEVESRSAGELQSNVRFSSELPLTEPSDRERFVTPPHIEASFGDEKSPFNEKACRELLQPESLEELHQAWSAMQWFQFLNQDLMRKLLEEARDIASEWNVTPRIRNRYASVLYGVLVFVTYADREGIETGNVREYALEALQSNAESQKSSGVSDADLIRIRIRLALREPRGIAFPGRPLCDENGEQIKSYTNPFPVEEIGGIDPGRRTVYPPGVRSVEALGLSVNAQNSSEANAMAQVGSSKIAGYLVPPSESNRTKHEETFWEVHVPVSDGELDFLANAINQMKVYDKDGREYEPKQIRDILGAESFKKRTVGRSQKVRLLTNSEGVTTNKGVAASKKTCLIIDTEWLYSADVESIDEEGEE
jgi:hypothetical protein